MAFNLEHFGVGTVNFALTAPNQHTYNAGADITATVSGAHYFDDAYDLLSVNDVIYCSMNNNTEVGYYQVTVLALGVVTAVPYSIVVGAGAVGTANLAPLAVTTAILDNLSVTTGKIAANAVDTSKLALNTIQYAAVAVTAANFNGAYAAPKEILPTPGANKLIIVDSVTYEVNWGAAQYANGGVFGLQYDNDTHLTGVAASATSAAAVAIAWAADSVLTQAGALPTAAATDCVNKSICLSNLTAPFITGDSPMTLHIVYRIVTTTF